MTPLSKLVFWLSGALLAYAQAGYGVLLAVLARRLSPAPAPPRSDAGPPPLVSAIVAAYREEGGIAERIANLRALEYPSEHLEVIVACDGSPDATPDRARAAGADLVLELPRGGKVRAQDAAVRRARGEIVAFSDANARWAPDALRRLLEPFEAPDVGYVCGQVRFASADAAATNQESAYWRYEMWLRALESRLHSVTGGNGAIYATRRVAYVEVDPIMGHDLSFPFNMVRRGWRALYAPEALATETMVPSIEGEFARKRRMMSHGWPILLRGGMLDLRAYPPRYALMLLSHRALRYATPGLHVALLAASLALTLARRGRVYAAALALQLAVLAAAATAAPGSRGAHRRSLLIARYYVLTTASLAAGLIDWLREETQAGWEPAEGTR